MNLIIYASKIGFHIHAILDAVIHFRLNIYTKTGIKNSLFFTNWLPKLSGVLNSYNDGRKADRRLPGEQCRLFIT
jgi:hypothetical protein